MSDIDIKLFNKWSMEDLNVSDPGLRQYMNLDPVIVPHTGGRDVNIRFSKRKVHVVERLVNKLMVTGHYSGSDKHLYTSGRNTGKKAMIIRFMEEALDKVADETGKNPVQVLINAVENGAPRAETTAVEYGGIRHPVYVDTAPKRRLDVALGLIAKGAMRRSLKTDKSLSECLAKEIILGSENSSESLCVEKKTVMEKQAIASK